METVKSEIPKDFRKIISQKTAEESKIYFGVLGVQNLLNWIAPTHVLLITPNL